MSEYDVCVVSGVDKSGTNNPMLADAYVFAWGGRVVARFTASGRSNLRVAYREAEEAALRQTVEQQAHAWIAEQS